MVGGFLLAMSGIDKVAGGGGDSDDELEIMAFMGRRGIRVDYEVKYELGKDMSEYCCWYILISRK